MSDCLFCRIAKGEIEAQVVAEGERWLAIRDIDPKAPTHVIVIPREHVATANDLDAAYDDLVGELVRAAAGIAAGEGIADEGYRLTLNCNRAGGQSVFHIHLHLLGGRPMGPMG